MAQSVSSAFNLYLECSDLAESSVDVKSRAVRYFIKLFGDMEIEEVTNLHAERYRIALAKGFGQAKKRGRKPGAVNTYVRNIKAVFSWLNDGEHIRSNPFKNIKELKQGVTIREPFKPAEVERMVRVSDTRFAAIIGLGLCGLREGEILNLNTTDVSFDKDFPHILIRPKSDTPRTWPWRIKNRDERFAPFPECIGLPGAVIELHKLMVELINEIGPSRPYPCVPPKYYDKQLKKKSEGTLRWRERLTPWPNFTRSFHRVLKKAAVSRRGRRFHDLRGTFAKTMKGAGFQLEDTQAVMGHSSPQTTAMYYLQPNIERLVGSANSILKKQYASMFR
jgi:integrase